MKNAIVNNTIGMLKREPKNNSESVDEVLFGMNIEILKEEFNNWFYVRTRYNYEGYINGIDLIINDKLSEKWETEKIQ